MANTTEQILLTLGARNNASGVFGQVDKDAKNMASSISSAISSINQGMMNIGSVTDNMMQGLTGKSAMDNILGTTSKAETNSVLLKNMLDDSEKHYDSFYEKVDKTTDESLTSMQELIPALKAFKSATGATDKEMTNITDEMANFGAAVLAQTGSTDLAQQSMMDLSKGVKGAFASLDQYGITQASLERTGYWNGDESDVEGFMKAVQKVTGSTEELMETNTGLDALIGKAFSRAGKKMGNEFLPVLKDIKKGFLELDKSLDGNLTASILAVSGGVEVMNQGLWNVSTTAQGIRDLAEGFQFLTDKIKGVTDAAETASDAVNTVSNVSDIGAGAGGAIGAGADVVKDASRTEKIVDSGAEGLMIADMLKGNKSAQKDAEKLLKELGMTEQIAEEVSTKHKSIYDPKKWGSFDNFLKVKSSTGMGIGSKHGREGILSIIDSVGDTKQEVSKVADVAGNTGDITKAVRGTEEIAEGVSAVASTSSTVSAAAPAMEAGAAGAEAVAAGSAGLAASFTSMIVPLLAISAVIIIMIPIVTVIAAEALIFIRLLADFMEALNFDNVNLDGAISGISQVATALAWVGVAMAAMSFASIMTGLAVITGGFLGITGPLDIAVNAIKEVGAKLSQFNTLAINPSVATNLKTISDSLMAVSSAMGALTWTNITTGFSDWIAGALGFSSVTDGLEQAKNDIIEASSKLQEFSSMPVLDESVAKNIQNVCDSLASVGDAMGALRSIRDGQNWDDMIGDLLSGIFGDGVDIQTALTNVRQDIYDAANALNGWNLPEVNEDVGKNVKATADALTSVSDAFNILKGFRDDNIWGDMLNGIFGEGTDIGAALDKVMKDINTAASKLKELKIGDEINDDLIKNIQKVVSALTEVTNVSNSLTNLPDMGKFDSNIITSAVTNLQTASDKLKGLTVGEVNEETITNIKNIAGALTEVSNVMSSLTSLPSMEGFNSESIGTAITNVQTAANELNKLNGETFSGESVDTVLGSIQTTLDNLKNTLAAASGFTEPSIAIGASIVTGVQSGISPLNSTVTGAISSAMSSASGTAASGGSSLGTSAVNGFRSTLNLHSVMETEMSYVKTAVDNGISAAKSAAESGAKEVVNAFKSGVNVGSPGDIARTMSGEMDYTKEAILNAYGFLKGASYNAARTIVNAFGEPSLDIGSKFNQSGLQTTVSNVPHNGNTTNTTIIITEGAVQVDARNKTEREAQQMFLSVLESFKPTGGI